LALQQIHALMTFVDTAIQMAKRVSRCFSHYNNPIH